MYLKKMAVILCGISQKRIGLNRWHRFCVREKVFQGQIGCGLALMEVDEKGYSRVI